MNNPNFNNSPDGFNETELKGGQPETPGSTDHQEKDADFWKAKFSDSTRGAQDLLRQNKEKDALIEELKAQSEKNGNGNKSDNLYEGFSHLPDDERKNLLEYTNSLKESVKRELMNDPQFAKQRQQGNIAQWEAAFNRVASAYPEINDHKDNFKQYINYNPDKEVPANIDNTLETLVKSFLYEQGSSQTNNTPEEHKHLDDELRTHGGSGGENNGHTLWKSLEEWEYLAKHNPAKFAELKPKFDEDMASGKL